MTTPDTDRAELDRAHVDNGASADRPRGVLGAETRSPSGGRPGADASARPVGPPSRRARRLAGAAGVVVAGALVAFLVISGVQARHQTRRTNAALAVVRAQERATLARLGVTGARLRVVRGQSSAARRTLATLAAELGAERTQLSHQQANLVIEGVSISALDTCLGGVEAALNEVGVNDQAGAVSSLEGVSASCRTAGDSVG